MLKLNIKKRVDEKFSNINQFAKVIGIGYNSAQRLYEGDVSRIEFSTLDLLCQLFNCTPNDIIENTPDEQKDISNKIKMYNYKSDIQDSLQNLPKDYLKSIIQEIVKEELGTK